MTAKVNSGALAGLILARVAAELASEAGAGGLTHGSKHLLSAPHDAIVSYLRDNIILPNLDAWESALDKYLPTLVTLEDKIARQNKTPEQRAQRMAVATLHLGTDFIGGLFAQVYGQKFFDHAFGAPHITDAEQYKVAFADRVIQLGAFGIMNTAATKQNKEMQEKLTDFFEKLLSPWNVSREDAATIAATTVSVRLPNLIGLIGSIAVHNHYSK